MKIDVIITAYNAEDTIERALQSCVNQVRKPNNVIVVDDCSQDSTYEKVRSFNDVLIVANFIVFKKILLNYKRFTAARNLAALRPIIEDVNSHPLYVYCSI